MKRFTAYAVCAMVLLLAVASNCWASTLTDYVWRPDGSFAWKESSRSGNGQGTKIVIDMTSQTWQGNVWKHKIVLFRSAKCDFPNTALLFITGNYHENGTESAMGLQLALKSGCPVAVLYDVPNQPLYGGKSEDALIAYTLVKYLETGDTTWPLLLPMTKSAVRAMDTVQAFFRRGSLPKIERFVVCGASKRGWTTWLTAAADPSRVKGIMPMVYDNLNLKAQMKQQLISFGDYSAQIGDYTALGLQKTLSDNTGKSVGVAIDPWTYRKTLTMPKLIINGSNDPYWTLDSLSIYWKDLKGPKAVLYMANSGHGLVNNDDTGSKLDTLVSSMSAFTRSIAGNNPIPPIRWKHTTSDGIHRLTITGDSSKASAKMWVARSASRDFRLSKWESTEMRQTPTGFTGTIELPKEGFMAVFGESSRPADGLKFTESTQVQVLDNRGKVK